MPGWELQRIDGTQCVRCLCSRCLKHPETSVCKCSVQCSVECALAMPVVWSRVEYSHHTRTNPGICARMLNTVCPGKFSDPDAAACTECAAGKYSYGSAVSCTGCPAGKHQESTGTTMCNDCPAGRATPTTGTVVCPECTAGKFAVGNRQRWDHMGLEQWMGQHTVTCQDCEAGYITASAGLAICTACPIGKHATSAGSSACADCVAGTLAGPSSQSLPKLCNLLT